MSTLYGDAYILMHPLRRKIVEILKKKECYTTAIAKDLGIETKERLVGFHLTILEKNGFVVGEFGLANPVTSTPKAVKYYRLTDKAVLTLKETAKELFDKSEATYPPMKWKPSR